MFKIEEAYKVFNDYVKDYDTKNPKVELKIKHTYSVVNKARAIAESLNIEQSEIDLACLIALLHDIGRFEQLRIYNSFYDNLTVDHADFGVKLLFEDKLIEKSKECFAMAIEIYNKPTIKYRVEGFSVFICNAWELMLKAYLIKREGEDSIYYKDNPERTITLENCIKKIFTNEKTPLRRNLEKIIELINTSTHFITEEYEMVYIPLVQACVLNFVDKMNEFHNVDMTEIVPQNFLALVVSLKELDEEAIKVKYPEEIANKLIESSHKLQPMIDENNQGFAIKVEHYHYLTKKKEEATSFVKVDNKADSTVI